MINIRMQPQEVRKLSPKLAVIGVGGAGGNAVNNMISSNLEGVEFIIANTDAQSLEGSLCPTKVQLGEDVTGGLGAGARPEIGRAAAEESLEEVMELVGGANMIFITAGMGGGTGTGAAPVIAKACREQGILTVGVVTKPFHFEGTQRMRMAEDGIEQMQQYVDTLIIIPNQNLFRIANEKTTFADAFKMADSVLKSGVQGVTDLMVMPGMINLDFADVRSSMTDQGKAMLGTGEATGERRAVEAAEAAINNPLLDDVSMKGAQGVIINITGGYDMTLFEADEACNRIREEIDPEANIIFGSTFDESLEGTMRVSVIATGIDQIAKAKKTGGFDLNKSPIAQNNKPQGPVWKKDEPPIVQEVAKAEAVNNTSPPTSATAPIPASALALSIKAPPENTSAPSAQAAPKAQEEPENELFEQQTFTDVRESEHRTETAQNTIMRGGRYQDSFIPPAPVMIDKAEYDMGHYTGDESLDHNEYSVTALRSSGAHHEADGPRPGYTLRPPVPGAQRQPPQEAPENRRSPSLFERITGLGTAGLARVHDIKHAKDAPSQQHGPSEQPPQAPMQGSLAIDSPAAPSKMSKEESDLEIPAFLRRQAN